MQLAACSIATLMTAFRARFRFRLHTKLNLDYPEHQLRIDGRNVVLSTPHPTTLIKDSEWLHMNAKGFASESEARLFATRLRAAAEVSSVATRVGIDSGAKHVTSGLARHVREQLLASEGKDVRDNIHGIDVFRDDPNVLFFDMRVELTALKAPEPFFESLDALLHTPDAVSKSTRDVVLLLNYALMRPEPVAQTVFSISVGVPHCHAPAAYSTANEFVIYPIERTQPTHA